MKKIKTLINKRTGKKLILDPENNPEDEIFVPKNSTLFRKRKDNSGLSERIFSELKEDEYYPTQQEIEDEVEKALSGINID